MPLKLRRPLSSRIEGIAHIASVHKVLTEKHSTRNARAAFGHARCYATFHRVANFRVGEDTVVLALHLKGGLRVGSSTHGVAIKTLILCLLVILDGLAWRCGDKELDEWQDVCGTTADLLTRHHADELAISLALGLELPL